MEGAHWFRTFCMKYLLCALYSSPGASPNSQAGVPAWLCQVRMLRPRGDLLRVSLVPDVPGSSRVPRETSGYLQSCKAGVGKGGAQNPFPFSCQPHMGAHKQPLLTVPSKAESCSWQRGLFCVGGGWRLGRPGRLGCTEAGAVSQPPHHSHPSPEAAADGW